MSGPITSTITVPDGVRVAVRTTLPVQRPSSGAGVREAGRPDTSGARGIVHVLHGMAEHARRYDTLAAELADAGYVVVVHDHRGHGDTSPDALGRLPGADGWQHLVDDALAVGAAARRDHPGVPYVLLGHSMGSLVARTLVLEHGDALDALILVGTAGDLPAVRRWGGLALARLLTRVRGAARPSPLLDRLSFGAFNRGFEGRTRFDWLSRDEASVDAYVADPRCGFVCSNGFFVGLLTGMGVVADRGRLAGIRPDLPVYIVAGDQDPVGDRGAAVSDLGAAYRRAGLRDVVTRLYPDARHEILQETNRDEVRVDLLAWLDAHLPAPEVRVIPLRRKGRH